MLKPWERWVASIALLLALLLVGCASASARVIKRATAIPHWQARYVPTPGDDMAAALASLTARLAAWGVTIADTPADVPIFGRAVTITSATGIRREIQLKPGLSINARFEVLAHEAGHFLQPAGLSDVAVAQVFAELVGVGIQRFYRSRTATATGAGYLAGWKWALASEPYLRQDIAFAVEALTGQRPLPRWRKE